MITPALIFWWRLFTTLALEVCCLAVLGLAAQWLARSAFWRRTAWQVAVLCLLAVAVSEWTGIGRGMGIQFAPRQLAVENKTRPPQNSFVQNENDAEVPVVVLAATPSSPEKQAGAVWWPGLIGLAGTFVLLARTGLAQGLLLALRFGRGKITDGTLRERLAHLSPRLGLRQKVCLRRMSALISPMAFGILRPCIGLPAQFETRFSPAEQDAILAHELAHLAARDPLWFLLADLAVAVLWWHPMAWWARQRLHVLSEQAADEATALVPDGPRALAQCLVALGKEMADMSAWGWVGINGGGFRSNLGRRVEGLLQLSGGPPPPLRGRRAGAAKITAMLAAAPLTVLAFGSVQTTQHQSDESWQARWEKSWRQSPAGVLLLAKLDDPAKTPKTNHVEKLSADLAADPSYAKHFKLDYKHLWKRLSQHSLTSTNDAALHEQIRQFLTFAGVGGKENGTAIYFNDQLEEMLVQTSSLKDLEITSEAMSLLNQSRMNSAVSNSIPTSEQPGAPGKADQTAAAVRTQNMIQNGKLLYEMDKFDQAEAMFHQVLKDDPANRSALYYMDLIKEARKIPIWAGLGPPLPHSLSNTNLIYTSKGRQRILSKLNSIMLDEVSYKDLPLKEVIRSLRDESVKRDPDGVGVNFMINSQRVDVSKELPASTVPGAAVAAVPNQPQDIGSEVTIRIYPPLRNVRLADVLDAITKTADYPIGYAVEDFAVVFSPKTAETNTLYMKRFRVDPNAFVQAIENVRANDGINGIIAPWSRSKAGAPHQQGDATNSPANTHQMVRDYFTALGIDLSPPKLIFWNDRLGELLVKATLSDLEIIQKALDQIKQLPQNQPDTDSKP